MTDKEFWIDYSFVMRSKQRKILIQIMNSPMTVTQTKKKTRLSLSEASRALRALTQQDLAECVNPSDTLGRVYRLTNKGKLVKDKIEKQYSNH